MAHPRMYDDDDEVLARLRAVCSRFLGTEEKESWGRPTFRAPKIYAVYGSGVEHPRALLVKAEDDERPALLADPRFFVPPSPASRPAACRPPPEAGLRARLTG